jgi:hypothetical protein
MTARGPLASPTALRRVIDVSVAAVPDEELDRLCIAADRVLLPLLTDEDHSDPALHANCHEAALTVAVQLWQSRHAPGGQMLGTDFGAIPTPHLGGPGLVSRVRGMLGPCEPFGGAVFA